MTVTLSDIKFVYAAKTAETLGPADIVIEGKDALSDTGFETCVLISLGTDARASAADRLPEPNKNRGGFWGSALLGFNLGSKYWLLERSKLTPETMALAKQYTADALQWLVDDGIASTIDVTVTRENYRQLNINVVVGRPATSSVFFTYYLNWENQLRG